MRPRAGAGGTRAATAGGDADDPRGHRAARPLELVDRRADPAGARDRRCPATSSSGSASPRCSPACWRSSPISAGRSTGRLRRAGGGAGGRRAALSSPATTSRGEQPLPQRARAAPGRPHLRADEPIVNGHGQVRVDDTNWRVTGPDLPSGTRVKVVAADGAVLKVEKAGIKPAGAGRTRGTTETDGADHGAKAPVPSGFLTGGRPTPIPGPPMPGIALRRSRRRIASPVEKRNCFDPTKKRSRPAFDAGSASSPPFALSCKRRLPHFCRPLSVVPGATF